MSAILVSPAEPASVKLALEQAAMSAETVGGEAMVRIVSSPTTERMGLDFAWVDARDQFCGVQRKELKDFIASATQDDRLSREVGQMRSLVEVPMVVIEGRLKWTTDNVLLWNSWGQKITRRQWHGMMFSLALLGVHVLRTNDVRETARMVVDYHLWSQKDRHSSLMQRPGPTSPWGTPSNRDYAIHLVQGIQGVGYETAAKIVDKAGGKVPFQWKTGISRDWLTEIHGIGSVKADKILRAIDGA